MFDDFLDGVSDIYNDVDGFFSDLTGGSGILDIAKAGVNGFYGIDDKKAPSTSSSTSTSRSLALDDMTTTEPSGVMSSLARSLGDLQPVEAVDSQAVSDQWFSAFYKLATGEDRA